jgi:hypothetical protein
MSGQTCGQIHSVLEVRRVQLSWRRHISHSSDRADAFKPISVAVFAGAAAWAVTTATSTCHGDHLIKLEMHRPEADPIRFQCACLA